MRSMHETRRQVKGNARARSHVVCIEEFFSVLQDVDVHEYGNFAKIEAPPLHGGE